MLTKKSTCLSFFVMLIAGTVYPQSESKHTQVLKIPTPNAAALINDFIVPVNFYRGTPDIKLPLLTLELNGLKVPVSLIYDASGLKVLQPPTWTGMGWSLHTGGVITRVINGIRDEWPSHGYMFSKNFTGTPQLHLAEDALDGVTAPRSGASFTPNTNAETMVKRLFGIPSGGVATGDSGPDEFKFSVNGKSGKFYINRDGVPVSDSKFKIEYTLQTVYPGNPTQFLTAFTLTDTDGVIYRFSAFEVQATTTYTNYGTIPPSDSSEGSVWNLTSIETPDGLTQLSFQYNQVSSGAADALMNHQTSEKCKVINSPSLSAPQNVDYFATISVLRQGINYLQKITTPVEEVIFETVNYPGTSMKKRLNRIVIRNRVTGQEWYYRFAYSDYGPTNGHAKFLLNSIYRGHQGGEDLFYQFTYNSTHLPYAYGLLELDQTAGIDHWGYYNGPQTNYRSLIPLGGAVINDWYNGKTRATITSRQPNGTFARTGMLERITLPTRGTIDFLYEVNDYGFVGNSQLPSTRVASGQRIRQITYRDDSDPLNDIVKTYSYESAQNPSLSSGVVPFEPVYSYNYSHSTFNVTLWVGNPILPIDVAYSQVTETNSDGGKTVYRFFSAIDYPPTSDPGQKLVVAHVPSPPNYTLSFKPAPPGNPFLLFDDVNTHLRGLLKEQHVLSGDGYLVEKTSYTYSSVNVARLYYFKNFTTDISLPIVIDPNARTVIFIGKSYINLARTEVSSELTQTFKAGDLANPVNVTKQYVYNSQQLLKEVHEQSSEGKDHRTYMTYPVDYNPTAMGGNIGLLRNIGATGLVIEELKTVNGKISAGSITEFDQFARATRVLNLESNGLISYSSGLLNPNNHISLPGSYFEKYRFRYNSGRLVEVSDNGFLKSWQWGVNNSRVIAATDNAPYNATFFTSFEESGQIDVNAKSGTRSMATPATIILPSWFTPISNLNLSYWFWNGQWVYKEVDYSGGALTISDGSKIDELRINPKNSRMQTYSHEILGGVNSDVDFNGIRIKYEYDQFGRLKLVRDNQLNIVKQIVYRYQN